MMGMTETLARSAIEMGWSANFGEVWGGVQFPQTSRGVIAIYPNIKESI
jgi:hypothetical protein